MRSESPPAAPIEPTSAQTIRFTDRDVTVYPKPPFSDSPEGAASGARATLLHFPCSRIHFEAQCALLGRLLWSYPHPTLWHENPLYACAKQQRRHTCSTNALTPLDFTTWC